jgi:TRAP-type mannitol/chloroaromatic compound transport system permease small subunit
MTLFPTQDVSFNQNVALRIIAALMVASIFLFLIDNILIHWFGQPGLRVFLTLTGVLPSDPSSSIDSQSIVGAWIQFGVFLTAIIAICIYCITSSSRKLEQDADMYSAIAAYIVRGAFWSVFLIGLTDMLISFVRVEGFLSAIVGDHYATQLGRSIFRGTYIHYPLIVTGFCIAIFSRSLGFIWLALLIVAAEFLIVMTRFVFSYEQAFMGDLVRFWYAGLFLFASAYTLLEDGHVRVDVLYANFGPGAKALTNICGSLFLGLPLCWNILIQGMSGKGSIINSPILSFEISQSGYGMYTKYLMAGYLVIFATSMGVQFTGYIIQNIAAFKSRKLSDSNSDNQKPFSMEMDN